MTASYTAPAIPTATLCRLSITNTPGYYYPIRVDRVEYDDVAPWPIGPDGWGYSLTRTWPDLYAYDPNN